MRPLFCFLLIPVCLWFQGPPESKLFPIPENMQYEFPGVKLSEADAKLLEKAFSADIAKDDWCVKKAPLKEFPMAPVPLGKLGSGLLVKGNPDCLCGGAGQCAMFVYVREQNAYRTVAEGGGWAFGVVDSKSDIPDLAFASSGGGGLMTLTLQNYDGRHFVDKACEMLSFPDGRFPESSDDWFDAEKVSVRPCENWVPHSPKDRH